MKVAILQSNYIPWKGYFDIVNDVDLFIFLDNVQYTKGGWRNRNKIKTSRGMQWLTVPVGSKIHRLIHEVTISNPDWGRAHWHLIKENYSKAPFFDSYRDFFESVYLRQSWKTLSDLNQFLIKQISVDFLGINTNFMDAREFQPEGTKESRVLDILQKAGASSYVSGPVGKRYLNREGFAELGIELVWKDYLDYPTYDQFFPPFAHEVSILDLLFHTGPHAANYIWGHAMSTKDTPLLR